jgi:3-deoxy-D-manno-octulosonic-acid transferase
VYWLYSFILMIAFVLYAPLYFFRMRRRGEPVYLSERLGLRLPRQGGAGRSVWIHAVSVGEVLSLRTLVARVKKEHPDWSVYFSTLTNTGFRVAREKLQGADSIFLVPLDFAWVLRRFFRRLDPDLFILAESEFWPNLLRTAHSQCRSVLLINGRMSAGSFDRYRRLRLLSRKVLANIDRFLVQTDKDGKRLEAIGLPRDRIRVAGNLKAEISLPAFGPEEVRTLRRGLGIPETRKVIVAGSTHRGEEEIVLRSFKRAAADGGDLALLIAPRHPERAEEVEQAAAGLDFRVARRTQGTAGPWQVLIVDTIGELASFYAIADIAFVGGSLVPHGGQNLLEPAFYGKPVFFGRHMENFAQLAEEFVQQGAAGVVAGEDELAGAFALAGRAELRRMGERAAAVLASLQGATELTCREIERFMMPGLTGSGRGIE